MLRLPDQDGTKRGSVSIAVEPGQDATILGLIRNQSAVVDNFDLSVRGIPEDWWTVTPATAYLVPYGGGGSYEQELEIHIHPPRSPSAQARTWPIVVAATSRAYQREVASAAASVTVGPYFDVATELRPERGSGRLRARYKLTVRNRANARTQVALEARDTDDECQFRFAEPSIVLEPGNGLECSFTVFPPRQIWIGKTKERRFGVTANPIGIESAAPPPPPRIGVYRQQAWLAKWALPLVAAVIAAVVLLLPKHTTVPNLRNLPNVTAAQALLNANALKLAANVTDVVNRSKRPGSIANQWPAPGTKVNKESTVAIEEYVGPGTATVPNVVGDLIGPADSALIGSGLELGAVSPQPPESSEKVGLQLPAAGTTVRDGTAVAIYLVVPPTTSTTTAGTTASGTTASGTTTSGSKSSGAAVVVVPTGPITIPTLQGGAVAAAAQLSQLRLTPKVVNELATVQFGDVAGTIPSAGTRVARGTVVTLLVSSGAPQLAYDDGAAVHVIDPPSIKASGMVPAGSTEVEPAWSFDGTELAYSGGGAIVLTAPNAKNPVQTTLTQPGAGVTDEDPSFAPTLSAHLLAFIRRPASGDAELCLATIPSSGLAIPSCLGAPGWDLGNQISWAPNGKTILVFGSQNGGATFGLIGFTSSVPFSTQASSWSPALETNDSVPGQGVAAGAFSPDGKQLALVSNIGNNDFYLYITPAGDLSPKPSEALPVRACQISWRSDSKELAVMQPSGACDAPYPTGTIVLVNPVSPDNPTILPLPVNAAHPAWQPVPNGG